MPPAPRFLRYFPAALAFLVIGIVIITAQTALANPGLAPLDHASLGPRAEYHASTIIPMLGASFPRIFASNAGVAFFIIMVPLLWVWVWWFSRSFPGGATRFMQATVAILLIAVGHNSFTHAYVTFRLLPWQVFLSLYLPHGWLEMLAFVLAGATAFSAISDLEGFLRNSLPRNDLRAGDVCLFIVGRVWSAALVILVLMATAAAIECFVTPLLVQRAYEAALLQV